MVLLGGSTRIVFFFASIPASWINLYQIGFRPLMKHLFPLVFVTLLDDIQSDISRLDYTIVNDWPSVMPLGFMNMQWGRAACILDLFNDLFRSSGCSLLNLFKELKTAIRVINRQVL